MSAIKNINMMYSRFGIQAMTCPTLLLIGLSGAYAAETAAPSPTSGLLQVVVGLGVVLAVMALVAWLVRRIAPGNLNNASALRIVGGVSVGNRERVLVLEVAGRWLVVGVAPGQVTSIANLEISTTQTPPAQTELTGDMNTQGLNPFAKWLRQALQKPGK